MDVQDSQTLLQRQTQVTDRFSCGPCTQRQQFADEEWLIQAYPGGGRCSTAGKACRNNHTDPCDWLLQGETVRAILVDAGGPQCRAGVAGCRLQVAIHLTAGRLIRLVQA